MKSRTFTIGFTAMFLTLTAVGSISMILSGWSSYNNYVNPYSYVPTRPPSSLVSIPNATAKYAIIFVLDGVRTDIFYKTSKPFIDGQTWANLTNVQCSTLTSVSKVGYSVISSGVDTHESQVISNDYEGLFKGDSLWNATIRHGNTTAFVGSPDWWTLFRPWLNYSIWFTGTKPWEGTYVDNSTNGATPIETWRPLYSDNLVAQYAGQIVVKHKPILMVVHFSETDAYAHEYGSVSQQYATAITNEDSYISQVLANYTQAGILSQTLVVIMADHGHVDKGGHGGIEPEVLHVPVLMRGPGVLPIVYDAPTRQHSVAPTVAALLGWEIPSDCSGTVLFDCLSLNAKQEAIYRIDLAQIRLAQAKIRLVKMGYVERYSSEVANATQYLNNAVASLGTNLTSATNSAVASENVSSRILSASWVEKVSEQVTERVILATTIIIVVFALVSLLFYKWRSRVMVVAKRQKLFLEITVLSVALYFVFFTMATLLVGWDFSASYFESFSGAILGVFLPGLLAFIPAGILFSALMIYLNGRDKTDDFSTVRWAAVFLASITIVYVSIIVFFVTGTGPGLPWFAPDVGGVLKVFYFVISAAEFVLFALIAFLGGLGLARLLGFKEKSSKREH